MIAPFKIYGQANDHAFMIPKEDGRYKEFRILERQSAPLELWRSPKMVLCDPIRADDGDRRKWRRGLKVPDINDILGGGEGMALNERAVAALLPVIREHVQLLPLDCDDGVYKAVHVLTVLDVGFDMIRSDVTYYDDGRPSFSGKRVLKDTDPPGAWPAIFRVRHTGVDHLYGPYVNDEFKRAYESAGLIGLTFEPVEVTPRT